MTPCTNFTSENYCNGHGQPVVTPADQGFEIECGCSQCTNKTVGRFCEALDAEIITDKLVAVVKTADELALVNMSDAALVQFASGIANAEREIERTSLADATINLTKAMSMLTFAKTMESTLRSGYDIFGFERKTLSSVIEWDTPTTGARALLNSMVGQLGDIEQAQELLEQNQELNAAVHTIVSKVNQEIDTDFSVLQREVLENREVLNRIEKTEDQIQQTSLATLTQAKENANRIAKVQSDVAIIKKQTHKSTFEKVLGYISTAVGIGAKIAAAVGRHRRQYGASLCNGYSTVELLNMSVHNMSAIFLVEPKGRGWDTNSDGIVQPSEVDLMIKSLATLADCTGPNLQVLHENVESLVTLLGQVRSDMSMTSTTPTPLSTEPPTLTSTSPTTSAPDSDSGSGSGSGSGSTTTTTTVTKNGIEWANLIRMNTALGSTVWQTLLALLNEHLQSLVEVQTQLNGAIVIAKYTGYLIGPENASVAEKQKGKCNGINITAAAIQAQSCYASFPENCPPAGGWGLWAMPHGTNITKTSKIACANDVSSGAPTALVKTVPHVQDLTADLGTTLKLLVPAMASWMLDKVSTMDDGEKFEPSSMEPIDAPVAKLVGIINTTHEKFDVVHNDGGTLVRLMNSSLDYTTNHNPLQKSGVCNSELEYQCMVNAYGDVVDLEPLLALQAQSQALEAQRQLELQHLYTAGHRLFWSEYQNDIPAPPVCLSKPSTACTSDADIKAAGDHLEYVRLYTARKALGLLRTTQQTLYYTYMDSTFLTDLNGKLQVSQIMSHKDFDNAASSLDLAVSVAQTKVGGLGIAERVVYEITEDSDPSAFEMFRDTGLLQVHVPWPENPKQRFARVVDFNIESYFSKLPDGKAVTTQMHKDFSVFYPIDGENPAPEVLFHPQLSTFIPTFKYYTDTCATLASVCTPGENCGGINYMDVSPYGNWILKASVSGTNAGTGPRDTFQNVNAVKLVFQVNYHYANSGTSENMFPDNSCDLSCQAKAQNGDSNADLCHILVTTTQTTTTATTTSITSTTTSTRTVTTSTATSTTVKLNGIAVPGVGVGPIVGAALGSLVLIALIAGVLISRKVKRVVSQTYAAPVHDDSFALLQGEC